MQDDQIKQKMVDLLQCWNQEKVLDGMALPDHLP